MESARDARRLEHAVEATQNGYYLRAIESFESLLGRKDLDITSTDWARYRSYHGLCTAVVWGRTENALKWCSKALQVCEPQPGLYLNLGLVQVRAGLRDEGLETLRHGLSLEPGHRDLLRALQRLTPRRPRFLSFLSRSHPVNRYVGLLRSRIFNS